MPQLVKGGKNIYGWSKVNEFGRIAIPPDAYEEYNFSTEKYAYLLSGSKRSGGFGLATLNALRTSSFSDIIIDHPELLNPELIFGKPIKHRSRIFCIVPIENMSITVPLDVLELYGIIKGSRLLTVRGSHIALGFIVKGPIIEEAHRHPGLEVYE
jgi:hypothetical protein